MRAHNSSEAARLPVLVRGRRLDGRQGPHSFTGRHPEGKPIAVASTNADGAPSPRLGRSKATVLCNARQQAGINELDRHCCQSRQQVPIVPFFETGHRFRIGIVQRRPCEYAWETAWRSLSSAAYSRQDFGFASAADVGNGEQVREQWCGSLVIPGFNLLSTMRRGVCKQGQAHAERRPAWPFPLRYALPNQSRCVRLQVPAPAAACAGHDAS